MASSLPFAELRQCVRFPRIDFAFDRALLQQRVLHALPRLLKCLAALLHLLKLLGQLCGVHPTAILCQRIGQSLHALFQPRGGLLFFTGGRPAVTHFVAQILQRLTLFLQFLRELAGLWRIRRIERILRRVGRRVRRWCRWLLFGVALQGIEQLLVVIRQRLQLFWLRRLRLTLDIRGFRDVLIEPFFEHSFLLTLLIAARLFQPASKLFKLPTILFVESLHVFRFQIRRSRLIVRRRIIGKRLVRRRLIRRRRRTRKIFGALFHQPLQFAAQRFTLACQFREL
jgi:hypothetical protein